MELIDFCEHLAALDGALSHAFSSVCNTLSALEPLADVFASFRSMTPPVGLASFSEESAIPVAVFAQTFITHQEGVP